MGVERYIELLGPIAAFGTFAFGVFKYFESRRRQRRRHEDLAASEAHLRRALHEVAEVKASEALPRTPAVEHKASVFVQALKEFDIAYNRLAVTAGIIVYVIFFGIPVGFFIYTGKLQGAVVTMMAVMLVFGMVFQLYFVVWRVTRVKRLRSELTAAGINDLDLLTLKSFIDDYDWYSEDAAKMVKKAIRRI